MVAGRPKPKPPWLEKAKELRAYDPNWTYEALSVKFNVSLGQMKRWMRIDSYRQRERMQYQQKGNIDDLLRDIRAVLTYRQRGLIKRIDAALEKRSTHKKVLDKTS